MNPLQTLPILYLDDDLVAVAKPSGMFVHRTDQDRTDESVVVQIVRDQLGHLVFPVHRIDRATSGIVLLATHRESAAHMSQAFADRRVSKTYRALVRGYCEENGVINTPLVPARGRGKPIEHPHAATQDATTEFRTMQRFEIPIRNDRYHTTRCSLLEITPRTGRYHQIRRHFNYESHPVIGDTSHGDSRHNRLYREHFNLNRLMLAAVRIAFKHPNDGQNVEVTCPPDESFSAIVEKLQKHQVSLNCPDPEGEARLQPDGFNDAATIRPSQFAEPQ